MSLSRAFGCAWRHVILIVVVWSTAPGWGFAWTTVSQSFLCPRQTQADRPERTDSTQLSQQQTDVDSKEPNIISSNFWYTVVRKDSSAAARRDILLPPQSKLPGDAVTRHLPPLPCVATLDADGMLPPDAYVQFSSESKPTSRIQAAWDVSGLSATNCELATEDIQKMVSVMQQAIDHGVTTFQIKSRSSTESISPTDKSPFADKRQWAEDNLYGSLIRETPATVLRHCQLIVPLYLADVANIPDRNERAASSEQRFLISPKTVRSAVVERLANLKRDSVDNLQIQFPARKGNALNDMYYLDLLDALRDVQREGLLRSVSACNMSPRFYQKAQSVGLSSVIESNQQDGNLLHPQGLETAIHSSTAAESTPWTVISNALAGGWLTDRYLPHIDSKRTSLEVWFRQLSQQERASWRANVGTSTWSTAHYKQTKSDEAMWSLYQSNVLQVLFEIARKHRSSVASVVLRWTLQCPSVASVVVACRLLPEDSYDWQQQQRDGPRTNRPKQLRDVFRFELDEEDMERLQSIAGSTIHDTGREKEDFERAAYNEERSSSTRSGLWVPGTGSWRKL